MYVCRMEMFLHDLLGITRIYFSTLYEGYCYVLGMTHISSKKLIIVLFSFISNMCENIPIPIWIYMLKLVITNTN